MNLEPADFLCKQYLRFYFRALRRIFDLRVKLATTVSSQVLHYVDGSRVPYLYSKKHL